MTPGKPKESEEIHLCPATLSDERSLAEFRCSHGAWYEDEVEAYINNELIKLVGNHAADHRLLLVLEGENLIGCAAHHLDAFRMANDDLQWLVRLQVMALGLEHQGRRLPDGSRLCDGVFRALANDAMRSHEGMPLTALVATENYRSLAMLERNGRCAQIRSGTRYIRLVGNLQTADV